MNINKPKNSAALAAKKGSIDLPCIDNNRLNFISTDVSFSRLFMFGFCRGAFCRTCVLN